MKIFDCSEGEAIVVDGTIVVYVSEIADGEVCLKIEAPEEVPIVLREDLDAVT